VCSRNPFYLRSGFLQRSPESCKSISHRVAIPSIWGLVSYSDLLKRIKDSSCRNPFYLRSGFLHLKGMDLSQANCRNPFYLRSGFLPASGQSTGVYTLVSQSLLFEVWFPTILLLHLRAGNGVAIPSIWGLVSYLALVDIMVLI